MNFIGKIFVVLIFAMSLVFMAFAVAVYGTHQNWKEKAAAEAARVQTLQGTLEEREAEKKKLEAELNNELNARTQALAKLEAERLELATAREELVKERDALLVKDKDAVAALDMADKAVAAILAVKAGIEQLKARFALQPSLKH